METIDAPCFMQPGVSFEAGGMKGGGTDNGSITVDRNIRPHRWEARPHSCQPLPHQAYPFRTKT